jgi:hypothetical protein
MTSFEPNKQVFILRFWCETREIEGASLEWRGVIEHLPSGQRRYFRDLDEIANFISPYLQEIGYRPGCYWRLTQWLKRWSGN